MTGNILTLTLQMRNHAAAVAANVRSQVQGIGTASTKMGTQFGHAVKAMNTSLGGLFGALVSVKGLIIAAFVYKAVQGFAKWLGTLSEEANKGAAALIKLRQGLASFGNYSQKAELELVAFSQVLQQQTGIADDVSQSMMGLLGTYGLAADKIKQLTPLIIDFAKVKGIDLKTAFDLVGKAANGYTATLARYGIILDSTLSKEQKMVALEQHLLRFKGTAIVLAGTYAGQIEILSANYGDLKEEMGIVLQTGTAQSGMLGVLSEIVKNTTEWFKKWGVVLANDLATGLSAFGVGIKGASDAISSSPMLWIFAELSAIVKSLYYFGKLTFVQINAGLQQASELVVIAIAKFQELWAVLFGSSEDKARAKSVAEEAVAGHMQAIDDIEKAREKASNDAATGLMENAGWAKKLWSADGFVEWQQAMEEKRRVLQQAADAEKAAAQAAVVNGEKKNEVLSRTILLTKTMAQQFALASKLEQEQTKFLMTKLRNASSEDIGNLSKEEKKLIGKQGVLSSAYEGAFGNYSEKQLGIRGENRELKAKLTIELTDEASQLLKASGEFGRDYRNVQFANAG